MTPKLAVDFLAYRSHIERALGYAGDTHTVDDVAAMVTAGHAQFWPGPGSCIVTQLIADPRRKTLHFFLAAGALPELLAMVPHVLDWGRSRGCTVATLVGRKGWSRRLPGWSVSPLVYMERAL